jgi:hypothetical protein
VFLHRVCSPHCLEFEGLITAYRSIQELVGVFSRQAGKVRAQLKTFNEGFQSFRELERHIRISFLELIAPYVQ